MLRRISTKLLKQGLFTVKYRMPCLKVFDAFVQMTRDGIYDAFRCQMGNQNQYIRKDQTTQ